MEPATLIGLSHRRAILQTAGPLSRYANIMLRLSEEADEEQEMYAKVIRAYDERSKSYIIHFTSVPTGLRARLDHLISIS
jgi:hypothetical protein